MSRIDEALRRRHASGGLPEDSQSVFEPAWRVPSPPASTDVAAVPALATSSAGEPAAIATAVIGFSSEWRERLATSAQGDAGMVEQFRRLAATLHHAQLSTGIRSVMVTSAGPGDGKTLTAVNLALVLAESYRANVLLIDADLRRPSIPSVVDLGQGRGLSEALRATIEQKLALVPIAPGLKVLPAGQPLANSIEALTSPRMQQILDEATARFDWVVIDAPPVGLTTDARLLTEMVGGTLYVIHAGKTQYADVRRGLDSLGKDRLLGVVLNGVEPNAADGYYGTP